jgi:CubicO group peptidase (beta-lactamase class C family)
MVAAIERGTPPKVDDAAIRVKVGEILNRHPCVGLALGVVRDGRLEFFHGHGYAELRTRTPIYEDTVFRVGSITKTFTTICVMQLVERGLIDLDAPAGDYLRAYRLVPAKSYFKAATVRHLLTHTAGIAEVRHATDVFRRLFGETVEYGEPVPTAADYYRGGLRIEAEPGSRFVYTDHDFTTLGQIVADVSGQPLPRYMREHLFEPLGMDSTDLVRSERVASRLATGYDLRNDGPRAIADYDLATVGGGAAYSTPRDIGRYIAALTGGGANDHGRVLDPHSMATIFAPHYRTDRRLPGAGLAFARFDLSGHLAVEHGGIVPGFISQIFVAPDDRIGIMAFTNGARLAMVWLPPQLNVLLRDLIGAPDAGVRADIPHRPEVWPQICGWYALSARLTDIRARAMIGAGVEVFVRRGQLMIRGLSPLPPMYRGVPLHPDSDNDPLVFRIDLSEWELGTSRIVFGRSDQTGKMQVSSEIWPWTLSQESRATNPRLWVNGAFAAGSLACTAMLLRRLRAPR